MSFDPITLAMMKKQLPCYDTRKQKERVVTFSFTDFNTDNIYANIEGIILLKVSDMTMTVEDFGQMVVRIYMSGELIHETTGNGDVTESTGGYVCSGIVMHLEEYKGNPNVTIDPGMYYIVKEDDFDSMAQTPAFVEITFPSVTTGELKTIDPKFLPSGGGGGIPIIDLSDIVFGEPRIDLTEDQVKRIGSTLECKCFLFSIYDVRLSVMCSPYLINGVVCGYQGQLAFGGQSLISFVVSVDDEPCIVVFDNPLTPAE